MSHLDFSAGTTTEDSFQISTDKQQRLTTPREFQRVMAGFLRDPPSGHTRTCRVRHILERGLRHLTLQRDGGKRCPVLQWDVSEVGSWTLLKWRDQYCRHSTSDFINLSTVIRTHFCCCLELLYFLKTTAVSGNELKPSRITSMPRDHQLTPAATHPLLTSCDQSPACTEAL